MFFFFFQAEDGIRDHCVTGVQTCALPISTLIVTTFFGPLRVIVRFGGSVAITSARIVTVRALERPDASRFSAVCSVLARGPVALVTSAEMPSVYFATTLSPI